MTGAFDWNGVSTKRPRLISINPIRFFDTHKESKLQQTGPSVAIMNYDFRNLIFEYHYINKSNRHQPSQSDDCHVWKYFDNR